jgi:hypothetical protein
MRILIIIAFLLVPGFALAQGHPVTPEAAAMRKTCADAMNADPTFANAIVETINADTAKQHRTAADAVAKNQKHVIGAYAAMWVLAAAFLIFMWRRQQKLVGEIAQLRRDLEAAAK